MILFPLQIDEDGGLLSSNDPLDLVASEVYSILDTFVLTRVMRMDYGSRTYILDTLNLGSLLSELNLKLGQSLLKYGFKNTEVYNQSTIEDFRSGLVKLAVAYDYGGETESFFYSTTYDDLRDKYGTIR